MSIRRVVNNITDQPSHAIMKLSAYFTKRSVEHQLKIDTMHISNILIYSLFLVFIIILFKRFVTKDEEAAFEEVKAEPKQCRGSTAVGSTYV
jgi:hypothetical protein